MHRFLRPLRAAVIFSALAVVALLVAGCGGGSSQDAKNTVKDAFSHSIKSANVSLNLSAKVEGVAQLQQPVQLKLQGPYQSNGKQKLPNLNWQVNVSGGGQSFSGGLISTGNNAFVSFQGSNYEVGQDQVSQINQQLGTQTKGKSFKDFGIDPANWLSNPQDKGDETVNGTDTKHVQADVDVGKMLNDLNSTIQKAGGTMGTAAPQQLTQQQIDQFKKVVKNPKMDVFVGKDDKTLRRLNVSIDFQIPDNQRSQFGGAQGGNLTFSLDLSDVGKPQTVTAPPNPKPISELSGALGGLGGAGGSGNGLGSPGGSSGSSGGGSSGGGGSNPSSSQVQKYTKCLQQADPSNQAEIQKCTKLLK